jgi:sulfate transport system ATP-binding protein
MSIEVNHISKSFGSFRALDDVSLTVPSGQLVALLGPSGSGKTTLLRIIAGLEQADPGSGAILFHDEDVADRDVRDRNVGFVFQHYALFRHMTVFQNVAFGLTVVPRRRRKPASEIRDRVRELLRLVQLEGYASRYPSQRSGGQRQRIALARALAVEPKVLLLDEPFGALDAKVRKELRAWLRRLHDEIHVTSVFVTHDQDEALEVSDQVVVMNEGHIEQIGAPDEIFHHPATEFVLRFLGDVNQFHGRVEAGQLMLGDVALPGLTIPEGASGAARVFVRPHDIELDTKLNGQPAVEARVQRVYSAGPVSRVELVMSSGQELAVTMPHERIDTLGLAAGRAVYIKLRRARVFASETPTV